MDEAYKYNVFPDACLGECPTPEKCACKEKKQAALEQAHKIRRFEIGLYWRRSFYFWGFQAAFFAAYALVFKNNLGEKANVINEFSKFTPIVAAIIALLGLLVSILWIFLERGSKAWQENWEHHIDQLEDEFTGRLHKTVLGKAEEFYSVTKINKLFIVVIASAWVFFLALPFGFKFFIAVLGLAAAILMLFLIDYAKKNFPLRIKSSFPNEDKHGMSRDVGGIGEDKKINIYYRWKE